MGFKAGGGGKEGANGAGLVGFTGGGAGGVARMRGGGGANGGICDFGSDGGSGRFCIGVGLLGVTDFGSVMGGIAADFGAPISPARNARRSKLPVVVGECGTLLGASRDGLALLSVAGFG